jgi:acyl-CoA thioester hydrolase
MTNPKEAFIFSTMVEKRWSDLDEFRIVNNAKIMTYLEEARIRFLHQMLEWDWHQTGIVVANANIDYKIPIVLTDSPEVFIRVVHLGNASLKLQCQMAERIGETHKIFVDSLFTLVAYDFTLQKSVPVPEAVRTTLMRLQPELAQPKSSL